ncbi:RNA dependent RNA polymerase-domain-containing protein [Collybia nuda]|uniref:RNA-dependent RNA polymerase n=1 Tax=Collybia nuda TaxID=64659 RepID=A0A9P6CLP6_9AGAR|nr:RNA dependent RNA polymerase-domain-containing protein [Collybia nuda]
MNNLTELPFFSANPPPPSQQTEYGEDTISPLIAQYEEPENVPTQPTSNAGPPSSRLASGSILGKRNASSLSDESSLSDIALKSSKKAKTGHYDCGKGSNDPEIPYIIAHDPVAQTRIASAGVSYGVQFEMARLVSMKRLDYDYISSAILETLKGTNAQAAPETARKFIDADTSPDSLPDPAFAREAAAKSPWEQLDIEESALSRDPFSGLGHSIDNPGWYGGRVEFRGKLHKESKGKYNSYKIVLDRCSLGPSCRFARRFGSSNFLRIKIPAAILHHNDNDLNLFFSKPFVLWGRIFRSFYAKDDTVFLFRTNEIMNAAQIVPAGVAGLSLLQFIDWHNPLEPNSNQTMTKWSARFALGLSNSVPGPKITLENIRHLEDILSPTGSDMTDGSGEASRSIYVLLYNQLGCGTFPLALQFRLFGAKGMLIQRMDTCLQEDPVVYLRPSQIKINYPSERLADPAHLIIEVLRTSYMRSPARVSPETIINLAENGVPDRIFRNLLKQSITNIIEGLTTWEGPDAMFNLYVNVERAGGVFHARRAREAAGEARARGLGDRSVEEADDEDEDEEGLKEFDRATDERSIAWWVDQISGCPSSLEETVMVLLDAGFTPQTSPVLREKLKKVVTTRVKNNSQKFRFDVLCSAIAFVVPDPYGVLGPDEIQVKCSSRKLQTAEGLLTDLILGDVLLTRNPCKLPTDVRKLKAVEHPQLREYVDVIVCTVQGQRRLLDFLAGGDYDGDTATVIWAPEIVEPFTNADEKYSLTPPGLDYCFSRHNERVDAFMHRVAGESEENKVSAMQTFLLGALRDTSLVGKYSSMHDNSIYNLGYAHPRTVKLAYKFCTVLDGAKTGLKILPKTLKSDMGTYYHALGPKWKAKSKKKDGTEFDKSNTVFLQREPDGRFITGGFIMDVLQETATKECARAISALDSIFALPSVQLDPHLVQPWDNAVMMAERGSPAAVKRKRKDLSIIAQHVQTVYKRRYPKPSDGKTKKSVPGRTTSFTEQPIEVRQDFLRTMSKKFAAAPRVEDMDPDSMMDNEMIARLRASYAYRYDHEMQVTGWSRFPWNVALRELCTIKASALGPYKTVTNGFYERLKLVSARRS